MVFAPKNQTSEVEDSSTEAFDVAIEQIHTADLPVHLAEHVSYGTSGVRGLLSSPYVFGAAFLASMGGFSFGYDQGVISIINVMPQFHRVFPQAVGAFGKGFMTGMLQFGCFIGCLFFPFLADKISRKWALTVVVVIFNVGAIMQTAAHNYVTLVLGRTIGGIGVGTLAMGAPLYISEISPPHLRGTLLVLESISIVSGVVTAFWTTYGTRYIASEASFRLPLGLQMVSATILGVGIHFFPYSPRWLALVGRNDECLSSLAKLRGLPSDDERVQIEFNGIISEAKFMTAIQEKRHPNARNAKLELLSWLDLFSRRSWRRTVVGVGVCFFQQFSGVNAFIYYAPTLFESIGQSPEMALILSGVFNILQLVAVAVCFVIIDKVGRRPLAIIGGFGCAICYAIIAILSGLYEDDWPSHTSAGWACVAFAFMFILVFGVSYSPLGWALPPEVFPTATRSKGVALSVAVNWLSNFTVGISTPPMLDNLKFGTYIFYGSFCLLAGVWAWYLVPETKGKTLEELDAVFKDTSGAEEKELMKSAITGPGDTDAEACQRCVRSQQECIRDEPKFKFGRVSGPRTFAQDQVWLATPSSPTRLRFVDETGEIVAVYRNQANDLSSDDLGDYQNVTRRASDVSSTIETPTPRVDDSIPFEGDHAETVSDSPDKLLASLVATQSAAGGREQNHPLSPMIPVSATTASCVSTLQDLSHYDQPQRYSIPLSDQPSTSGISSTNAFLQAILIRYYTENLAHWFDLNDPLRHFTRIVPLRCRHSRPLLNAILTVSARQLVRARCHRNSTGAVQWQGHVLSDLNEELAMHFQNECIGELLNLSLDPERVTSADLLAAAVILRTDEEMDTLFRADGADDQVFLGVTNAYIDAQSIFVMPLMAETNESFAHVENTRLPVDHSTTPEVTTFSVSHGSLRPRSKEFGGSARSIEDEHSHALREACFWAACRQDVHASIFNQRPINFPLQYCDSLRNLAPAEDYVWTIRTIIFCADVLELCYGRYSGRIEVSPAYTNYQRWREMKQRAADIRACLPASFEPTYFSEPHVETGEVFPHIWFQDPCYATGVGHIELTEILLTVFDPSTPKMGLGKLASNRKVNEKLKSIVLRLCGIATSNRNTPPNFINAFTAIVLWGENLIDAQEQKAVLGLLESMQHEFAYYTERVAERLRQVWYQH